MHIELGIYKHYKGNEYAALGVVKHSETVEDMVLYRALYGKGELWVRPITMWSEEVDVPALGYTGPRFMFVRAFEAAEADMLARV